jgi:NADH-quinone oxidoreductase subunit K
VSDSNITWWSAPALFCLGLLGVILRRNLLVMYMGLELMLNAANLALVAFSRYNNNLDGQVMVFFIITVAAAEVSVGLALIVALYRKSPVRPRRGSHVAQILIQGEGTGRIRCQPEDARLDHPAASAAVGGRPSRCSPAETPA